MIWGEKSFGRSVKGYLEVILLHFSSFFLLLGGNETRKNRGEVPAEKCLLRNCIPLLEVRFLPKQFVTTIKKVHRIDPAVLYRASGIFKKCEFFFGCICNHFHDFLCFSLYENYLVVFWGLLLLFLCT